MTRRHSPEEARESLPLFDFAAAARSREGSSADRASSPGFDDEDARSNRAPLTFNAARARDDGMANASAHANAVDPVWLERAIQAVRTVACASSFLLAEDVRKRCPEPFGVSGRVWGAVMREAAKRRLVVADGVARAETSNASWKVRWRSLVHGVGVA